MVKEPINDAFEQLALRFSKIEERFNVLQNTRNDISNGDTVLDKSKYVYRISKDMIKRKFIMIKMKALGYNFQVYHSNYTNKSKLNPELESQGIWLGINVTLEIAKEVISNAKSNFPFLSYILLVDQVLGDDINETDEIFIGGSTKSAKGHLGLLHIDNLGFEKINEIKYLEELHHLISQYSKN